MDPLYAAKKLLIGAKQRLQLDQICDFKVCFYPKICNASLYLHGKLSGVGAGHGAGLTAS